jgi:sulfotransferase family protein
VTAAPVFVAGSARSGTTLLQALIGAHPDIAAPPEMHWFLRVWSQRDYWGDITDDDVARRVAVETVVLPAGLLDDAGFDVDRIAEKVLAGPRTYPSVLDIALTDFAERHGKSRWSEKTPDQAPAQVWEAFPDAQVVHIVRDPRDVVASALKAPFTDRRTSVVDLARTWRDYNVAAAAAGKAAGADRYLQVRYETLCNEPEATMNDVFAFLGAAPRMGVVDDLGARSAAVSPGAWWTHAALQPVRPVPHPGRALAQPQRALVGVVTAAQLPTFGYLPPSPPEQLVGRAGVNALRFRRRVQPVPRQATPSDPTERHALVEKLIDETVRRAMGERHK